MRFVCDSCRAQYMISDEKVGARGVKVRCKKCGYVILVRKGEAPEAANVAAPPPAPTDEGLDATQVMQNPLVPASAMPPPPADPEVTNPGLSSQNGKGAGALAGVGDDEIGAVFDQVLQSGTHKVPGGAADHGALGGDSPDDRMSTRVLDAEVIRKLADEAAQTTGMEPVLNGHGAHPNGKNGVEKPADHDWFVAVDEKQVGPLKMDKVKERWDQGEIGPDSLCWRAGFGDWLPLSEVGELASVLAPKPKQPVIVGTAPEPSLGPVVTVPVESAFTSGGVTRTVRSEVPMMTSAPSVGEDTGWKPSAASALASLVKEEIEALAKPAPVARKRAEPEAARAGSEKPVMGLLDLPSQEHQLPESDATIQHPVSAGAPFSAAPSPSRHQAPMRAPLLTPAPYGAAPYQTNYKPAKQANKTLIYIAGGVGGAFLILVGLVVWLVVRQDQKFDDRYQAAAKPDEAPVLVAKSDAPPPANAGALTPPVADTAEKKVEAAAATPVAAKATPAVTPSAEEKKDAPLKAVEADRKPERKTPVREREEVKVARRDPPPVRKTEPSEEIEAPAPKKEEKKPVETSSGDIGDDFDDVFGGGSTTKKTVAAKTEAKKDTKKSSVYIPPAPGAVDVPDKLQQSDIMSVVLGNRSAIKRCVDEQKKQNPGMTGRLVMRWTIKPTGKTSGVSVRTAEYKSTYLASCISGLVKGWSFPRHKTQGEPIDFPFTF